MEEEERSIPVSMRAYLNSSILVEVGVKYVRPFKVGAIMGKLGGFPRCTFRNPTNNI